MRSITLLLTLLAIGLAACSGAAATDTAAVRVVAPEQAADVLADEPDRVVIDIRTPEEFASGHLEGAELIDFYAADFADRIGELDRDTPYLIYCRSGNRSGQARQLMADMGFVDVLDVDGGIAAWAAAGLPMVT